MPFGFFKCKHPSLTASRNDKGLIIYHCDKCKKRVFRQRNHSEGGGKPVLTALNVRLDMAKSLLFFQERKALNAEPKDEAGFIEAMALRFRDKAYRMGMDACLKLAREVYKEYFVDAGASFGHKDYDWSRAAAHEVVDEYMAEFFEPLGN